MADKQGILDVLASRAPEFQGTSWMPRRLLDLTVVVLVLGVVSEVVREVVALDVEGLPATASLQRSQRELGLSYERLRRDRTRDHASFFRELGTIFKHVGHILEELARMERGGHLD